MVENDQVEGKESNVKRRAQIPKSLLPVLKQEYLEGKGSIRELSEKYNVSPGALAVRCAREKWNVDCNEVVRNSIETVKKFEVSRLERLHSHEDRMILRMEKRLESVDKSLEQVGDVVPPDELKMIVSTEATIDSVIRRNLGGDDKQSAPGVTLNVNVLGILDKLRAINQGKTIDGDAIEAELRDCKLIEG